MQKILEFKNVNKEFKNFSLKDINFSINEGEIVGFIGANGAGKSTTIKLISKLLNRSSGEISIFNINVDEITDEEKQLASFILDENCFPSTTKLTVLEKILSKIYYQWDKDAFFDYLLKFNINPSKQIKQLSKGMKAKLNIAISLSHHAKFLILDEPTNGLDPIARDDFLQILEDFRNKNNGTIFISSHILSDLERICDRIIFIDNGKIIIDAKKRDLLNKYYILNVSNEEFSTLNKEDILKVRRNGDYFDVLVLKNLEKYNNFSKKDAQIEDIMVMEIRGE